MVNTLSLVQSIDYVIYLEITEEDSHPISVYMLSLRNWDEFSGSNYLWAYTIADSKKIISELLNKYRVEGKPIIIAVPTRRDLSYLLTHCKDVIPPDIIFVQYDRFDPTPYRIPEPRKPYRDATFKKAWEFTRQLQFTLLDPLLNEDDGTDVLEK